MSARLSLTQFALCGEHRYYFWASQNWNISKIGAPARWTPVLLDWRLLLNVIYTGVHQNHVPYYLFIVLIRLVNKNKGLPTRFWHRYASCHLVMVHFILLVPIIENNVRWNTFLDGFSCPKTPSLYDCLISFHTLDFLFLFSYCTSIFN